MLTLQISSVDLRFLGGSLQLHDLLGALRGCLCDKSLKVFVKYFVIREKALKNFVIKIVLRKFKKLTESLNSKNLDEEICDFNRFSTHFGTNRRRARVENHTQSAR